MPAMDYYHHFTPRISTHESEFENSAFEFVPSNPPPIKGNDVGDNVEGVQSVQDPLQAAPIQSPPAPPTISTFSASSRNQIHIVQTYVHSQSGTHNPFCTNPTLHTQFVHHNGQHNNFFGEDHLMGSGSGQPPRPANAWILYRSDKMRDLKPPPSGQPRPPQADISKLIAAMWKNEQPEIKQHYETLSDLKKAEHLALYPGYRFQPMKKADKDKARAEKRAEKERERAAAVAAKGIPRKPTRTTKRQSVEPGDESRMAEPAVESSSSSSQPTPITMPSLLNPSNIPIGSATLVPNFVTPPPGLTLPPGTQLVQWPALPAMRAHPNAYSPYQTKAKKKRTRAAAQEQQEPSTKPEPSLEPSLSSPTNFWTSESLDHNDYVSVPLPEQSWDPADSSDFVNTFTSIQEPHALEPVANDIFQFTNFDASTLQENSEVPILLPDDYNFESLENSFGLGFFDLDRSLAQYGFRTTEGPLQPGEHARAINEFSPPYIAQSPTTTTPPAQYVMSPSAFASSFTGQSFSGSDGEREPPLSAGTSQHSDWGQFSPPSQHSTPVRW